MQRRCATFSAEWFDWLHLLKTHTTSQTPILTLPNNAHLHRIPLPHPPPTSNSIFSQSHHLCLMFCKHIPTKSKPSFLRLLERRGQTQQCTQSTTHKHVPLVKPSHSYISTDPFTTPFSASCPRAQPSQGRQHNNQILWGRATFLRKIFSVASFTQNNDPILTLSYLRIHLLFLKFPFINTECKLTLRYVKYKLRDTL